MEIIIGIIFTLVLEFGFYVVKNEDNCFSRKVRIIVLTILSIFYFGFMVFLGLIAYDSQAGILIALLIMLVILFGGIFIWQWYKILKNK